MITRFYLFFCCLNCFAINYTQAQAIITIDFSHERGFYDNSFDLVVNTNGYEVITKYTIDGSEPNAQHGISPVNANTFTLPNINHSTVVRVYAYNSEDTISKTHTYIFPEDVFNQNNNTVINQLTYPSQWGYGPGSQSNTCISQAANYAMNIDTSITSLYNYEQKLLDGLMEIPTMAISIDRFQIFGADSGLYIYPIELDNDCYILPRDVNSWERKASIEIFNDVQEQDTLSFQVNAGLKIAGASSRYFDFYKHSFKLKFRSEYGAGKLKYPLFEDEATKRIESLQLRMVGQCSPHDWDEERRSETQLHKDSWAKHLQKKLSGYGSSTTSKFFHLFINGLYWGLYDVTERPDEHFMAEYNGGEPEDYDIIKVNEVKNGSDISYKNMYDLAHSIYDSSYSDINEATANVVYDQIKDILDVNKFLDYIFLNTYFANNDWVINNWVAARNFKENGKFEFFIWDAEMILNDFGRSSGSIISRGRFNADSKYHPIDLHQRLLGIPEYQIKFVDKIQCNCLEEDGILYSDSLFVSYKKFGKKIHNAALLEFARWGNARESYSNYSPLSCKIIDEISQEYENEVFPFLAKELIKYYGNPNTFALFPAYYKKTYQEPYDEIYNFKAVQFPQLGGEVPNDYLLVLTNPNQLGKIYYTTNGIDPRNIDGTISTSAIEYTSPILIDEYKMIKARVFTETFTYEDLTPSGTETHTINDFWTAMCPREFFPKGYYDDLVINEIHYHPPPISSSISGNHLEFIEIKNIGESELNITNTNFTKGIKYQFPIGSKIPSNGYVLLAADSVAVENHYQVTVDGQYEGKLDNSGENIEFSRPDKIKINAVDYDDDWNIRTDGNGASLSLLLDQIDKDNNHLEGSWGSSANGSTPRIENLFCASFAFNFETAEPSCYGGSDGFINLNLSGGTGNFDVEWSTGSTFTLISNLTAGNYAVTVADEQNCVEVKSIILAQPSPINSNLQVTHASSLNSSDGYATVNPNGQSNNYTISWSDGSTGTTNNNLLPANNYWFTITDNSSTTCSITEIFSVEVASSCEMPNNFSAVPTSDKGAILSWSGGQENTSYTLSYKASNEINWTAVNTSLPNLLLNNLEPCTYYDYKVIANCNSNASNTSTVKTFVTSGCNSLCNGSEVIGDIINITNNSAFILWDIIPNAKYRLNYRKNGVSTWRQYETPHNFSILFGLDNCADFEWFVDVICPNGSISANNVNNFTTIGCVKKKEILIGDKEELNNNFGFTLYPNPSQSFIKISSNYPELTEKQDVIVYDLSGRMVKDSVTFVGEIILDIENLHPGIYVAQVVNNHQNLQYRFRKE